MGNSHVVRYSVMGNVGQFLSPDGSFRRGSRVILRSSRGLEVGQVLAEATGDAASRSNDGVILRSVVPQDELLLVRMEKDRLAALDDCQQLLKKRGLSVALVDAELLFDGRTLLFYFLGDVPEEVSELTLELSEAYDAKVRFRSFIETMETGCGPGCGTESAAGGGCTDCHAGCGLAGHCGVAS